MNSLKIGTCSWNYHSWVGLVYSKRCARSSMYLNEYAQAFRTAEIDSWFYKIPDKKDVYDYLSRVDEDFTFSCKVTNAITLTHHRSFGKKVKTLTINENFLSHDLFQEYIDSIRPMLPYIGVIMLEFEYLNVTKMPSLRVFLQCLDRFINTIDLDLPLAIETRNKNYLQKEYFEFLKEKNIGHVFSEKIYMPHIYNVYDSYGDLLNDLVTIRLLGGDRKEIEEKTKGKWNAIVDEKKDLNIIVDMIQDLTRSGKILHVYVNNHYEGSAPITIRKMQELLV